MKITDENEDIKRLEEEFGMDSIELFILSLSKELTFVDYMLDYKPWEIEDDTPDDLLKYLKLKVKDLKHMEQKKLEREK